MTAQLFQIREHARPQQPSPARRAPAPVVLIADAPPAADELDAAKPRMAWQALLLTVGLSLGAWAVFIGLVALVRALLAGA